ncbi:MAG TPA: ATP synthase F1 subunit delta [Candidatus Baltobacteraceae bacterium]|nr:ATP synthase F1 subunit delta [Candidatus Baltobacteraceae bacterium]
MISEVLARRYATAVFELAQEAHKVDQVGSEFRAAIAAIERDPETKRFFEAPVIQRGAKSDAIIKTFKDKVDPIVLHTLLLLVRKRRERILPALSRLYDSMALDAMNREPLEIVSARPLDQSEVAAIVERLSKRYGKSFEVRQSVDPRLLGGMRIQWGGRYIDGSLEGKLQELSRDLYAHN